MRFCLTCRKTPRAHNFFNIGFVKSLGASPIAASKKRNPSGVMEAKFDSETLASNAATNMANLLRQNRLALKGQY